MNIADDRTFYSLARLADLADVLGINCFRDVERLRLPELAWRDKRSRITSNFDPAHALHGSQRLTDGYTAHLQPFRQLPLGSDSVTLYGIGAAAGALFGFPFFLMADTGSPGLIWLGIAIELGLIYSPMAGAQPAFFSELFPSEYRYSGVGGGRELGAIIGGATPAAASALLLATDSFLGPGALLVGMCLVTVATMFFTPETLDRDLQDASLGTMR